MQKSEKSEKCRQAGVLNAFETDLAQLLNEILLSVNIELANVKKKSSHKKWLKRKANKFKKWISKLL